MNNITEHISDLTQLARLKMYIDKQKEDSDNKAFIIVLGVILGIIVVAAAIVAVLTVLKKNKKEDKKTSLYDDLDKYYDAEGEMNFSLDEEAETKSEEVKDESEESETVNE